MEGDLRCRILRSAHNPDAEAPITLSVRNYSLDVMLLLIVVTAAILRIFVAVEQPTFPDEEEGYIPLAQSISLSPVNLPLHGKNHPALVAYVVKASGAFFGETKLGFRGLNVIAGILTLLVVYRIALEWYGVSSARWATALLAINEYHVVVSGVASSHAPHFLLISLSLLAFSRFLRSQHPGYLYATATATALAYYCKEHSVLLLVVFVLLLLTAPFRHWFRNWHLYLALGLFAMLIVPDIVWNLTATRAHQQAKLFDHLSRIGGVGLSWHPWAFFAHDFVASLHLNATGKPFLDEIDEYTAMNVVFGSLLLGGIMLTMLRGVTVTITRFLLAHFLLVFGTFAFIRPPERAAIDLDAVSWAWVDTCLLSSVILTGGLIASAPEKLRKALLPTALLALIIAVVRVTT